MIKVTEDTPFTTELLYAVVTESITKQYYQYPKIRARYQLEDLIQENILWFYKPMRNGEQRLEHYLKTCQSTPHVVSIIRLATSQSIPEMLRLNAEKYAPSSLNELIRDEDGDEFIDMVRDTSEAFDDQITTKDELQELIECYLLEDLTPEHLCLFRDLVQGYKSSELRSKYPNFKEKLEAIQNVVRTFYLDNGTSVEAVLGTR